MPINPFRAIFIWGSGYFWLSMATFPKMRNSFQGGTLWNFLDAIISKLIFIGKFIFSPDILITHMTKAILKILKAET